jgi:hypothetical protein
MKELLNCIRDIQESQQVVGSSIVEFVPRSDTAYDDLKELIHILLH